MGFLSILRDIVLGKDYKPKHEKKKSTIDNNKTHYTLINDKDSLNKIIKPSKKLESSQVDTKIDNFKNLIQRTKGIGVNFENLIDKYFDLEDELAETVKKRIESIPTVKQLKNPFANKVKPISGVEVIVKDELDDVVFSSTYETIKNLEINKCKNMTDLIINDDVVFNTKKTICVFVNGNVDGYIESAGNVIVKENVNGNIDSSGNVSVEGHTKTIDAGGNVTVGKDVNGDVDAGGNVTIGGNVKGDIDAGGNIRIK